MHRLLSFVLLLPVIGCAATADDWPQFRFDAARSGYAPESLPDDLSLIWEYRPAAPPAPAWVGEDTRMSFDHAPQAVVAGGRVFFGSSADNKVYALDAATGVEVWSVHADAAIRFAPCVDNGRVYVASDDGMLYCLEAATGTEIWRKQLAPGDDMVLGNGRLVSRWPVRGGPAIDDNVLYVSAGIWPSEGIYIQALDPATGDALWTNDTAGYIEMDQPHGGARAKSGVSAQGYLTIAGDALMVPTGRATPAALAADTGEFRYFRLQEYNGRGHGPFVTAVDDCFVNELDVFRTDGGDRLARGLPSAAMAVYPDHIVYAYQSTISAVSRSALIVEKDAVDKRGAPIKTKALGAPLWTIEAEGTLGTSLIGAGDMVVAGVRSDSGGGIVVADTASQEVTATAGVDGLPLGLAAAGGRLYVTTDQGTIYCFGAATGTAPAKREPTVDDDPYGEDDIYAKAADEIIERTGITVGYCVDIGCGDGRLSYELAKRSELNIYAIDADAKDVAAARERLDSAGLHGTRVTVLQRKPGNTTLPNLLANLVVSGESVTGGKAPGSRLERERLQRPYGGVICVGKPGSMTLDTRGALEGAGEWTHQYANAGNEACSTDEVKGPLGMLWYADNTLVMPSRHGRGPSPLFWNGVFIVEGIDAIRAVDAYNGTQMWEHPLPGILKPYDQEHLNGVAVTGSNICIADGKLFARHENKCAVIDVMSGEQVAELTAPPKPDGSIARWGYISCADGTLFGSLYNEAHQVTFAFVKSDMSLIYSESALLFALDATTGETKWTYQPEHSVRINTIAVGDGKVFLLDRPIAVRDRDKEDKTEHPAGKLVALDADTGDALWSVEDDIYGTMLALSEEHNILLMSYQATRFRLASEAGGRMSAFNPDDGARIWDVEEAYASRPLINDDTIYAQPGAWDLRTGERKDFNLTRSYGCGILAGSKNLLAYRSATLGYWDLTTNVGTENYGGIRPGCWINALPVGGMLLVPEASNRCRCSYLIKATIALQPYGVRSPRVDPVQAADSGSIDVRISADDPAGEIRYTLDGTSPTRQSKRYARSVKVTESATLTARVFRDGVAGPTSSGSYIIDPDIIPLGGDDWQVHDTPGAGPPESNWALDNGIIAEISNHFLGEAGNLDPLVERPGTYRAFAPGADFTDGEVSLDISSADDDGIGIAFRFADREHHYLFTMDRQRSFRVLALKNGDEYEVVSQNATGFVSGRWYALRVVLDGSNMSVWIDGEKEFEITDETLESGTFALYSWGSTGAKFRNVKWKAP